MFPLPILATAMTLPDLDALRANVAKCEKAAVSKVFTDEPQRRAGFLVDSVKEQQDIAAGRLALAERRRKLRTATNGTDTADAITATSLELDDRQQALNDRRAVDAVYREALDFLRQHYLTSCAQGSPNALNK